MHEINVLAYWTILAQIGGYPDLNRELTVPQTVVLPIELYPPYVEVIRTPISKYQKFMTYRLVYNIWDKYEFKSYSTYHK